MIATTASKLSQPWENPVLIKQLSFILLKR